MRSATNLFRRDDTFFGVCEGLGQDLGIHPNLLRLAFAGFLFWNPYLAIGAYLGLGLFVAVLRWTVPDRIAPAVAQDTPKVVEPVEEIEEEPLPLAA